MRKERAMIEIKLIDRAHEEDLRLPNEPFTLFGRMVPQYVDEQWSCTIEPFPSESRMTFPDEHYSYDALRENSTFLGAYDEGRCVGLAVMQEGFFKYMYLYDLKVNASHRRQGIAKRLIKKAEEIAAEKGYIGIYTQGQDDNLGACLFYLHTGFEIGGFDQRVYDGTKQEGKADIYFYKRISGGITGEKP